MVDSEANKLNIAFITYIIKDQYDGIYKKVVSQFNSFNKYSDNCHIGLYCKTSDDQIAYSYNNFAKTKFSGSIFGKLTKLLCHRHIYKYIIDDEPDLVYIRHNNLFTYSYIRMLKRLFKRGIKIIIEIPTFPYDGEYETSNLINSIINKIDVSYRNKIKNYVYRIVTFSDLDEIWGVKTIKISNAVDFDKIPIKNYHQKNINKSTINLIGVASLNFWHGYDRILTGIKECIDKNIPCNIHFDIVGGKPGQPYLQELINYTKKYNLTKYVTFHFEKSGDELNILFDKSDIAVGCLGCHRKNINNLKSLKNIEYAARGVPFIYSELNSDFDDKSYIMKVPPDESPIDILSIVDFYKRVSEISPKCIRDSIIDLSWDYQIKKILKSL